MAIRDGLRTELSKEIGTGQSLLTPVLIQPPAIPGTYTLVVDLLREHTTWFADQGSTSLEIPDIQVQNTRGLTWQRGRILCIVAGALLLLFMVGFGTTRFFAPDLPVVLSPLLGISVVIALSYYGSLLGVPMAQTKWVIFGLGGGAAVAGVIAQKSAPHLYRWQNSLLTLFMLVMLFFILLPLWDFGRPSSPQKTYSTYFVTMSEYWQHHTLHDLPTLDSYQPLDYLVRERILNHYIDAPPFLNAFIASSLHVDSYETYAILTAILLALLIPTLYWVARTAFGLSFWASALVALLALSNVTYHIWFVHAQLTFVSGFLFVVLTVGAGALLIEQRSGLIFKALSLSALLALYPALFLYGLAPIFFYGCLRVCQKALSLRAFALTAMKVLALLIILNPVMFYSMTIASISASAQIREDWHNIPGFPTLAELLGMLPHYSLPDRNPGLRWIAVGFVPVALGIVSYGLYRTWMEGRRLLTATVAPYFFGALIIALWLGYAYGYYKHGVASLFALLVAFAFGIESLWQGGSLWGRCIALLGSATFLFLNLSTLKATYGGASIPFVSADLAAVGRVRNQLKEDEVVFINDEDTGSQLWTSYFLWGTPISVPPLYEPWGWWGFSSVFGRGDASFFYHPQATYTLAKWGEIIKPYGEPVWSNSTYLLHAGTPFLLLGQGWHQLEEGPPPARWMAEEGTLKLAGGGPSRRPVRLSVTLVPIVTPLSLEVFGGEEQLGVFAVETDSHSTTFLTKVFPAGEGTITIRSRAGCFVPARLFGGSDRRCLSASFQDIRLIQLDE
jgi:hypothetical protein